MPYVKKKEHQIFEDSWKLKENLMDRLEQYEYLFRKYEGTMIRRCNNYNWKELEFAYKELKHLFPGSNT